MSDWGRSEAAAARRRSPWPFSLGLVIGIAAMAALVFFRFSDIERLIGGPDPEVARLQAQVADLKREAENAAVPRDSSGPNEALRAEIVEKTSRINLLEREIAELREGTRDAGQQLFEQLRQLRETEIPALEKQRDQSRREAGELEARLKLAEGVNSELQKQAEDAVDVQIPALKAEIERREQTLKQFDAEIARLTRLEDELKALRAERDASGDAASRKQTEVEAENSRLQSSLAEAKDLLAGERRVADEQAGRFRTELAKRDAELARLAAEVSRLNSVERELDALRKDRETAGTDSVATQKALQDELDRTRAQIAAATGQISEREAELDKLKEAIRQRDKVLEDLDGEVTRLGAVETELKATREALAALRENPPQSPELAGERAKVVELRSELEQAQAELASAQAARADEIDALRKELAQASAENARLEERIAALSKPEASPPGDTGAAPAQERPPTPRDPLLVARAISEAAGLGNLTNQQRDRLGTGLIEGECVSKVLSDVFGRAPAVTVRDLIQTLDSDC